MICPVAGLQVWKLTLSGDLKSLVLGVRLGVNPPCIVLGAMSVEFRRCPPGTALAFGVRKNLLVLSARLGRVIDRGNFVGNGSPTIERLGRRFAQGFLLRTLAGHIRDLTSLGS